MKIRFFDKSRMTKSVVKSGFEYWKKDGETGIKTLTLRKWLNVTLKSF